MEVKVAVEAEMEVRGEAGEGNETEARAAAEMPS